MSTLPISEALSIFVVDALWAALAGLGFALVFNIPRHNLAAVLIGAALGHGARALAMALGMNMPAASLLGATLVGIWALCCQYHYQRPALIFAIAGVIPMIPGKFAYLTMIGLIHLAIDPSPSPAAVQEALHNMVMTALVLGGLAFGIAAPQLLQFKRRH